ncbi:DUF881 domain-containing protein [Virgibacillus oceani]|uniref:UPF0749 protein YlxW n=1 Tax=Virgibacillus oceani TaxID=1479511 RepID=A0A917H7Q5_9BACI|nr:DUF881 domain-containing protein [Virgibacillus oceani]GGG69769.1 UPF0749 protein YlxW [Virgibacillus oceani]
MKLKGRHVVISLILLVSGFLVAYSYQQAKDDPKVVQLSEQKWEKNYEYRKQAIDLVDKNKELREELDAKMQKIQDLEAELSSKEELVGQYVDQKKQLQLLTGKLAVAGDGVQVALNDANYIPNEENANNYIVHESHIHKVVNELFSAGAKAVAINGQRIMEDSFIACIGPVISVDGVEYPAPFIISAIGDPEVLFPSITLTNGVKDQLESENIEVNIKKVNDLEMDANIAGER